MATELFDTEVDTFSLIKPEFECDAVQHLVAFGKRGTNKGEFNFPKAISVHEGTGDIYVVIYFKRQIQIYSETGLFLKNICDQHLERPWGILTKGDCVYVTDISRQAVFLFTLPELKMEKCAGSLGAGFCEFNFPLQLALAPDKQIYVADCRNHRLQILDCNLNFKSSICHQSLTRPVDVKFTADQMLVLSETDNTCVHVFTHSGQKISSIISRGNRMLVNMAFFFCLDGSNNIIISDYSAHSLKMFTLKGDYVHTIGKYGHQPGMLHYPTGIAMMDRKIVCVSRNTNFALQIFFF